MTYICAPFLALRSLSKKILYMIISCLVEAGSRGMSEDRLITLPVLRLAMARYCHRTAKFHQLFPPLLIRLREGTITTIPAQGA